MAKYWAGVGSKLKKDVKAYYFPAICITAYIVLACLLHLSICPVQLVFGIPCPGCGITRALVEIFHGQFMAAWSMHPFIYVVIGSALMYFVLHYFTNLSTKWFELYCTILGGLMIAFYIYRMIRFFPNQAPMERSPYSLWFLISKFWQ